MINRDQTNASQQTDLRPLACGHGGGIRLPAMVEHHAADPAWRAYGRSKELPHER